MSPTGKLSESLHLTKSSDLAEKIIGINVICIDCITPEPLKDFVRNKGEKHFCKYCDQDGQSVEDEALFRYILDRVNENVAVEEDLSFYELGMLYECGSDGLCCTNP
jgi:hypothetical protein